MDESLTNTSSVAIPGPGFKDGIHLWPWFIAYGVVILAMALPLGIFLAGQDWAARGDFQPGQSLTEKWESVKTAVTNLAPAWKLLAFGLYLALCSTFLPMPTSWIVAAVALPAHAVGVNVWMTVLLVTLVGSAASVVANLNDYHIFTLMLRHRHIGKLRHTRTYRVGAHWFSRSPFLLLVMFNFIPIPVDVVRLLATSYRYPRLLFAASNFIGRVFRYAVIALVTYNLKDKGWIAVVVLLAFALLLSLERMLTFVVKRTRIRRRARRIAKCSAG